MHFFFVATFFILSILQSYPSQCSDSGSDISSDTNEWDFMTEIAPLIGQELTQSHDHKSPEPQKVQVIELSEISTQKKISADTQEKSTCLFPQKSPGIITEEPHHSSFIHKKPNNQDNNTMTNNTSALANIHNKKKKVRKKYIIKNNTTWTYAMRTCLQYLCCMQDDAYSDEEEEKKE
jgi:hypothetical protein